MHKATVLSLLLVFVGATGVWWFWIAKRAVTPSGLIVMNVLDKDTYDDCHIKGSVHVPFEQIDEYIPRLINKQIPVIVYCSNHLCLASHLVAKQLQDTGFTNVRVYGAGMARWYQEGLPVEGPCTLAYLRADAREPQGTQEDSVPLISTYELARIMGYVR